MNPVLQFLQDKKDGYTFNEGVAVLLSYSSNKGVNDFILARRDKKWLVAELGRLAHIPNLKPVPGREPYVSPKDQAAPETNQAAPETEQPDQKPGPDPTDTPKDDDPVTFLTLKRHETYKPEDLPTPILKELWVKNRDEYKELQHCHAQMKQANSDEGRAAWRKRMLELRDSITKRWKLFDEEMARIKAAPAPEPQAPEKPYNPLNDRAYISRALKKETWNDTLKVEVQRRVDALVGHGASISDETRTKLAERGIKI